MWPSPPTLPPPRASRVATRDSRKSNSRAVEELDPGSSFTIRELRPGPALCFRRAGESDRSDGRRNHQTLGPSVRWDLRFLLRSHYGGTGCSKGQGR